MRSQAGNQNSVMYYCIQCLHYSLLRLLTDQGKINECIAFVWPVCSFGMLGDYQACEASEADKYDGASTKTRGVVLNGSTW